MSKQQDQQPVVGIVMGSDSDWPTMRAAADALDALGVPYEADVVSAHRMPDEMLAYGREAADRGLRVIIAGAGGAAHLPGMLAAVTELPVIGVPVPLKYLDGMDSLLSIVQMPAGVPVATVSIGGARNAGLLAARILGAGEGPEAERLRGAMRGFQAELADTAHAKGEALRREVAAPRLRPAGPCASGRTREAGPVRRACAVRACVHCLDFWRIRGGGLAGTIAPHEHPGCRWRRIHRRPCCASFARAWG